MEKINFSDLYDKMTTAKVMIKDWCFCYGYQYADAYFPDNIPMDNLFSEGTMDAMDEDLGECASSLFDGEVYEAFIGEGIADYMNDYNPSPDGNPWVYNNGEITPLFEDLNKGINK